MANLRDIRRRLKAVENIKKITDAMERMAAARFRRAQSKAEKSRPYVLKLQEIVENLTATEFAHPLFEQRKIKKTGLIVISGDRGLSGSYTAKILSATDHFLKKYNRHSIELILFGRKAIDHYSRKPWTIGHKQTEWGGKFESKAIKEFANQLTQWFISGKFDEIWLIYTHYISIINREVLVEKFLNIEKTKDKKKTPSNYIFEPNPEEILTEILQRYCFARFQAVLDEAYASELAARIVAMQTASKNSENMINDLTLIRNKVRQEGITKEIIEVSSAAN
jgi:F-type H+-transporting ATPase subunit gamma